MNIGTKTLTGWLLFLGPILMFVFFGLLWPVSHDDTAREAVTELANSSGIATTSGILGTIAFAGVFLALTLLARSLKEEGKPGASGAVLAAILFPICAAVVVAQSGLHATSITEASDGAMGAAITLHTVAEGMWPAMGLMWGISYVLVGLAIAAQNASNEGRIVGGMAAISGALMFLSAFIGVDVIEGIAWILVAVTTLLLGVQVLRAKLMA